jgi:membrane protease YdiL (CAAX protease family)
MKADGGKRLAIAFVLVAIWAAITLLGGLAQAGQGSLEDLVSRQITWATPTAALFLLVSAWLLGWRDLGLNGPRPTRSIGHLWLLAIYIVALGLLAVFTKTIPTEVLIFITINTFFVGFSEELAFRGVLWGAARKAMPFWAGVLFVSAAFGSIHILNTFITGDLGGAAMQAMNAFLSGLAYLAIRIRTRSIVPIFIAHWLWDLVVFLNASSVQSGADSGASANPIMGAVLVAPIALYGLWIIRKRQHQHMTDNLTEEGPNRRPKSD